MTIFIEGHARFADEIAGYIMERTGDYERESRVYKVADGYILADVGGLVDGEYLGLLIELADAANEGYEPPQPIKVKPRKGTISNKINSVVSTDAKQSLVAIAEKYYNNNQTAALNGLLLNAGMTQLGESIEFKTTYNGQRVKGWALPEVALGGDGWANLRVDGELVHRRQVDGVWLEQEVSEVLDEGRF